MPHHHVIIGSGIAGLVAAETLRKEDTKATITMISEEPHDFYSRPGLAYYLRGDFPEKQLSIRSREDINAIKVQRINGVVERLAWQNHEVHLSDGQRVRYDRVLLATGALAVPPSFPGSELQGIVKLDGLDDCRKILQLAKRGQPAVVIGGGITALELAEGLNARGMNVHFFLRSARYWGDVLDETESKIVMERLRHEGITILTQTQIAAAVGKNGKVDAVQTQAGAHVPCSVLAVAIGVRPRVDLAKKAGLTINKGVIVNEYLETSAPDVYAAGDVAEYRDPVTGAGVLDVLWPTAIDQAKVAGANMAGVRKTYIKGIPFNVTMLAGLRVAIIGSVGGGSKNDDLVAITRGESEAWRIVPKAWVVSGQEDINRIRIVVGDTTIVGALVMGNQSWARPLERLITAKVDITPIRQAIVSGGAESLRKLAEFFHRWEKTKS